LAYRCIGRWRIGSGTSCSDYQQGNQRILSPRDITDYLEEKNTWPDWRELDAIFFQGDSIVIEGVKIEAYSIGKDSDVVKVSKVSG